MNLKKILILPVGFVLTNFLYIACCKCPDPKSYYEVTTVTVKTLGSGGVVIDNGIPVTTDTVYLNYNFINRCVAKTDVDFSFLVSAAMACKCNECGRSGIKNKLTTIKISSDSVFNGIAANQPLNSFFKVNDLYNSANPFSIDSLINSVNNNYSPLLGTYSLFTKVKPGNTAGHKFTLTMNFVNGTTVSVVTNPIKWQ